MRNAVKTVLIFGLAPWPISALAQQAIELPGIVVTGVKKKPGAATKKKPPDPSDASATQRDAPLEVSPYDNSELLGQAQSGSEGVVPRAKLLSQPTYRTGELLEAVPGLVVTQHSGEGKANQYFLRGFNLDHGTDFAVTVDGMPVNMRTHGHGQGYADTNFIIPEIMRGLIYRKGPYFASEGDFSSAGAVHLDLVDSLPSFAQIEFGSFGHRRAVTALSTPVGPKGSILAALEYVKFDGPWERPDDLRKLNGVLRYAQGTYDNGFSITGMAYMGQWFATDQIPKRAVPDIGLYGTLDPTDGGDASRFSLSARWSQKDTAGQTQANAYVVRSRLALFNNFTYFLDDQASGDQFKQSDSRLIAGGAVSHTFFGTAFGGLRSDSTFGVQTRYDDIDVGLFKTVQRQVHALVREDHVREFSIGLYGENTLRWTPWLRSTAGLRADLYTADVKSDRFENSGSDLDTILSPKLGLVFGPWSKTELYLNAGTGFHSNDARGTVTTLDPTTLTTVPSIPFLVRSKGAEIGLRSEPSKDVQSTLAFFVLDFDSEIVFVGDAGTTEASRPSRRIGLEYTLRARLLPWLMFDLDAAYTRARFLADDPLSPVGKFIPGATEGVLSAGLTFGDMKGGWFGGMKVRYFGPRPLIEDDSIRSKPSYPVSARLGYVFADGLTVRIDAFNLLNEKTHQIDYFYASRLGSEPGPVDDLHFHPTEPRSVRLVVRKTF